MCIRDRHEGSCAAGSPNITTKNNIKGVGNFTVKYFKEDNLQAEINEPKDVGTYIVKITAVAVSYTHLPILQYMFHGYVRKSKMLKAFLMMNGNGAIPIFLKNYL